VCNCDPLPPALAPGAFGVLALGGRGNCGIGVAFGESSAVSVVCGVDVRDNTLEVGAGVVVAVDGAGDREGGGGGGGGYAGALEGELGTSESSHCDGEPSPGDPILSGGSAETAGAADAEGDDVDAVLWELWARRCGRRMFSRGMFREEARKAKLSLCVGDDEIAARQFEDAVE
jgi:hypothetical protein